MTKSVKCRYCEKKIPINETVVCAIQTKMKTNPLNPMDIYHDADGNIVFVYCKKCWDQVHESNLSLCSFCNKKSLLYSEKIEENYKETTFKETCPLCNHSDFIKINRWEFFDNISPKKLEDEK